jgi:ABC-type Mn2+/Zn2+ transport system permease subunit
VAWVVAAVTTVLGLSLSAVGDMPTGASLVSCFGAVLVLFALLRTMFPNRQKGSA